MRKLIATSVLAVALVLPVGVWSHTGHTTDMRPSLALKIGEINPDNVATFGQPKGERAGACPDGSYIQVGIYDPAPEDPEAVVYFFHKGNVPVALRVVLNGEDKIYVYAAHKWFTTEEIRAQYASPCDIPISGR